MKVPFAHNLVKRLNDRQRETIVKLASEGYTLRVIGERFGVNYKSVRAFLKEHKAVEKK